MWWEAVKQLVRLLLRKGGGRKLPPKQTPPRTKPTCKGKCDSKPNPYRNQTREQNLKSKASQEKRIAEHQKKLEEYKRNPQQYDNKGIYRNAPSQEIRDKIYRGRIEALQKQIEKQEGELRKIIEALGN